MSGSITYTRNPSTCDHLAVMVRSETQAGTSGSSAVPTLSSSIPMSLSSSSSQLISSSITTKKKSKKTSTASRWLHIHGLPIVIFDMIFSRLPSYEMYTVVEYVCKLWRQTSSNGIGWRISQVSQRIGI
jgi:hypothetical protein